MSSPICRVAIVGAGNAGLTAAKYLLAERRFSKIDIIEQRNCVGGLWKYTSENDREASFTIPQTTADAPHEEPIWRSPEDISVNSTTSNGVQSNDIKKEPTFVSPMYERLEANLPKSIMAHCDLNFPDGEQLFPSHQACLEYLDRYANDVRHLIRFETQIQRIQQAKSNGSSIWTLSLKDLRSGREERTEYDAVVVASGHFTVPFVPDIPGIREWDHQHPGSLDHSKFFRRPEDYKDKRILTVGKGYSGLDITSQIAPHCKQPLIISTRSPPLVPLDQSYEQHPEITSLDPSTRTVFFADGTSVSNIDHILFCTGYLYSYPFFPPGSLLDDTTTPIWTMDGARPHNLYQYIFYNANPTLAFLSIPQQIVPFPVCDSQAAVMARVWSGRLDLPSREEMVKWENETVKEKGEGKKWLWLKPPADGVYLNMLADWADSARPGSALEGCLELPSPPPPKLDRIIKGGPKKFMSPEAYTKRLHDLNGDNADAVHGKAPARWGGKEIWMRERILEIKKAFAAMGEERHRIGTLEELGFDYEEYKAQENGSAE